MSDFVEVIVSAIPSKLPWIEGVDYTVQNGPPQPGDMVRRRRDGYEDFAVKQAAPAAYVARPITMTHREYRKHIITVFGGNAAAREKLQTYIDAAIAEAGVNGAAKRRRNALDLWRSNPDWTKPDATDWLDDMQFSTAAPDDKGAIRSAWPEA